jgi:hypothetical protein
MHCDLRYRDGCRSVLDQAGISQAGCQGAFMISRAGADSVEVDSAGWAKRSVPTPMLAYCVGTARTAPLFILQLIPFGRNTL